VQVLGTHAGARHIRARASRDASTAMSAFFPARLLTSLRLTDAFFDTGWDDPAIESGHEHARRRALGGSRCPLSCRGRLASHRHCAGGTDPLRLWPLARHRHRRLLGQLVGRRAGAGRSRDGAGQHAGSSRRRRRPRACGGVPSLPRATPGCPGTYRTEPAITRPLLSLLVRKGMTPMLSGMPHGRNGEGDASITAKVDLL
jgi:hypothetical protein